MAYHAGKRVQEGREEDEYTQARLDQLEQQQAMMSQQPQGAGGGGGGGGMSPDAIEQLKQLADLKAQGVLTEEEFNQQKYRLLQGS